MPAPPPAGASGADRDAALLDALLAGDEGAFLELVRRYRRPMLAVAASYVVDMATAEDVVQETWAAALAGLARFERRSSLKTWLFRILANRARSRGGADARNVPLSALDATGGDGAGIVDRARFDGRGHWLVMPRRWELDGPEAIAARAELVAAVEQAAEALPPRQRAAVLLRDVEDLDPAEACALLGVADGAFRVLLHRGRGAIREAIEARLAGAPLEGK
jgi:RNA polymerase sigma-70 factor (ECF subfamily)